MQLSAFKTSNVYPIPQVEKNRAKEIWVCGKDSIPLKDKCQRLSILS